jgi:hypothetical protein
MKKIALIIMMIALPFLLLMGIFHIGKDLQAPQQVNGQWTFIDVEKTGNYDCAWAAELTKNSTFSIDQSGKFIHLLLSGEVLPKMKGLLEKSELNVHNHQIALNASIDPDSSPISMMGEIKINECEQPIPFSARLESEPLVLSGGH